MNDVLADSRLVLALLKLDLVDTLEESVVSIDADVKAGYACCAERRLDQLEDAFCTTKTVFHLMGAAHEFDAFIDDLATGIEEDLKGL